MFLRGLPTLCTKMKRPPNKFKSVAAAAAARNTTFGADSGTPDFYRISKIGPLPPAIPYLPDKKGFPIATERSQVFGDEDGLSARSNTSSLLNACWIGEASIAAIDMPIKASGGAHDDVPLLGDWLLSLDTSEKINQDDPLKREGGESDKVKDPLRQESSDEILVLLVGREAQNSPEDAGEESAVPSNQSQEPGEILSEADMEYLAHQNRSLLKHAKEVERRPAKHLRTPGNAAEPNQTHYANTLCPNPRTLNILWEEYVNGIDGRKAACLFTSQERGGVKHKYYRRKVIWDCISALVRAGLTAQVAIDRIYDVYGPNTPFTRIINQLKRDTHSGKLHRSLQI
jgi:hypothetical protein